MKKRKIALCYDFDGTLSPGNMQEYDFMKKIGMTPAEFWEKSKSFEKNNSADSVLSYMRLMIEESARKGVSFTRQDFRSYGRTIPLYAGVDSWFDRVNAYAKTKGLQAEHYIISSGLREMILGNAVSKNFKTVYASSFMYDDEGNAKWPAMVLNYTTKTQFIFRINKGCFNINDPEINAFVPDEKRYIPLSRMIYIGDGMTDVPCMRLVKSKNGFAIAVFDSKKPKAKEMTLKLTRDGRANFCAPADYQEGSRMDELVKTIIDKIAVDLKIEDLKNKK